MEKTMYPQVPNLPVAPTPDAPPSYNQAQYPASSAPPAEFVPMVQQTGASPIQPAQTVAYINNPGLPPLGPRPCAVTCPSCHQATMSKVRYETATKTHLFAAVICLLGLCCCTCVPYCVDSCKNPNHYCSNCDAYLGTYNK